MNKEGVSKNIKVFLSFFVPISLFYSLLLLAFWPGIVTYDSANQWGQAINASYTNAHPFIYSLLMSFSNFVTGTPVLVTLLQVCFIAFFFSSVFAYFYQRGISVKILFVLTILLVVWPVFLIYNVSLWKDIFYSLSVVVLSFFVYLGITKKENYTPFIIFLSVLCATLRHNGIIYLLLPAIIFFITNRKEEKKLGLILSGTFLLYVLVSYGLAGLLRVTPAGPMTESIRVKIVAAIYQKRTPRLNNEQRIFFESILDEKVWKEKYDCAYVDDLYSNYFLKSSFISNGFSREKKQDWHKNVSSAAINNLDAIIWDKACFSKYMLGFGKYSNPFVAENYADERYPELKNRTKLLFLKSFIQEYANFSSNNYFSFVLFWAPWPILFIFLGVLYFTIKRKLWGTTGYIILVLANTVFILIISPVAEIRYLYPSTMGIILLPLLYLDEKSKQ